MDSRAFGRVGITRQHGGNVKLMNVIRNESGFSLTELMVVLIIIGVLVLLALPRLLPVVTKAKAP